MIKTANFAFLAVHDFNLPKLGGLAERYFREDPPTCLIKLRQLAELVAKLVAARTATYAGERETFEETLRRLSYERLVPREVSDLFHRIRSLGNEIAGSVTSTAISRSRSAQCASATGREAGAGPPPSEK